MHLRNFLPQVSFPLPDPFAPKVRVICLFFGISAFQQGGYVLRVLLSLGRRIGNHTLRRTCARMWYRASVPVATISSLLGHSDTKTTLKYLGLVLDDLKSGAQLFDAYFQQAEHEKSRAQNLGKKQGEPV